MGAAFRSGHFGADFARSGAAALVGSMTTRGRDPGPQTDLCVACASSGQLDRLPDGRPEEIREAQVHANSEILAMKSLEGRPDFDRRVRGSRKGGERLWNEPPASMSSMRSSAAPCRARPAASSSRGAGAPGRPPSSAPPVKRRGDNGVWTARARGASQSAGPVTRSCGMRWSRCTDRGPPASTSTPTRMSPEPWRGLLAMLEQTGLTPIEVSHRLVEVLSEADAPLPVAFAVDDADMADNESMAVLTTAIRRVGPERAWLVASTHHRQPGVALRPVDRLLSEPQTRHLVIGPLQAETVGEAIQQFSGQAPSGAFRDRCYRGHGRQAAAPFRPARRPRAGWLRCDR